MSAGRAVPPVGCIVSSLLQRGGHNHFGVMLLGRVTSRWRRRRLSTVSINAIPPDQYTLGICNKLLIQVARSASAGVQLPPDRQRELANITSCLPDLISRANGFHLRTLSHMSKRLAELTSKGFIGTPTRLRVMSIQCVSTTARPE